MLSFQLRTLEDSERGSLERPGPSRASAVTSRCCSRGIGRLSGLFIHNHPLSVMHREDHCFRVLAARRRDLRKRGRHELTTDNASRAPSGTRRARGGPTRQLPSSSQSRRRSVERCPASRRHRPLSFLPWLAREGAAAVGHLFARERERDDCMLIAALIACRWVHLRESERERLSHVAVAVGRPKTNGVFAPRGLLDVRSRPLPAQLLIRKPRSLSPPRAHSRSVCSCYRLAMSDLSASTPDGARHSARPQRLIRLSPN